MAKKLLELVLKIPNAIPTAVGFVFKLIRKQARKLNGKYARNLLLDVALYAQIIAEDMSDEENWDEAVRVLRSYLGRDDLDVLAEFFDGDEAVRDDFLKRSVKVAKAKRNPS